MKAGLFKLESWLKGQKGNFRANSSFSFRAYSFLDEMSVRMPFHMWNMQIAFVLGLPFERTKLFSHLENVLSHNQHAKGFSPVSMV